MEEIQHLCPQQHILLLKDKDKENSNGQITCQICKSSMEEAPCYVCHSCKYYVHKSCEELPKKINHHFHPRHPLSLGSKNTYCDSCDQVPQNSLMFSCESCGFDLDVECTLMSNSITTCPEGQHCIRHSSHPHLLLLVDTIDTIHEDVDIDVRCFACQSNNSPSESSDGGVYYGCKRCEYFLHKQCIDQLPQKIQISHLDHHSRRLSLRMKRYNGKCFVCTNSEQDALYFECSQCEFKVCLECGFRSPRIIYEDHPHFLCFIQKKNTIIEQCNVYDTCLKLSIMSNPNEFHKTDCSIFECLDCNFNLHLLCGPLPSLIKHHTHIHCLTLVDSFIEDNSGEYYCDICEEERNPRFRFYYCGECKYAVHVHCVIPEIINVLKGDIKDVKLKVIGEDLWNFPKEINYASQLTLEKLFRENNYDERSWVKDYFSWYDIEIEPGEDKIEEVVKFSNFTENDFMSFIFEQFHSTYKERKLRLKPNDLALKVVDIKCYSIPSNLVSAMKNLLHKYGDISSESGCSQIFKSICFYFVCKVMKEMHTTLIIDITKDLLQQWYHYIKFADDWGDFKIDFMWTSLEKITRDFYYQQLSKLLDLHIPTILENRMADLQKKMAEKISMYKDELDKCKKFRESSTKEDSMKKGLDEATKAKWKFASEIGLF